MKIEIRPYKSSDYDYLLKLLNDVYQTVIEKNTLESIYLTEYRSILIASSDEEVVVGCAFVEIQDDFIRPNRIVYVTYVAVNERMRNKGIGQLLFKEIEKLSVARGATSIELTSADFRTGAHAFYHAIGFSKKKTTVFIKEIS